MVAYVYIMANKRYGTIYVGVTTDLARRAWEHRDGVTPGFTKRYGLKMLVYYGFTTASRPRSSASTT